jgi:hypothetical protein
MAQHQRRIDRVLGPEYLAGLEARSLDEIRDMDRECSEIETELSYVRKLAQARLDIIQAEVDRRAARGLRRPSEAAEDPRRRAPGRSADRSPTRDPASEIDFNRGLEG